MNIRHHGHVQRRTLPLAEDESDDLVPLASDPTELLLVKWRQFKLLVDIPGSRHGL